MSAAPRDTIAAIATPPGVGALCVVRVSGPKAREVLRRLCPGLRADPPPRRLSLHRIVDPKSGEEIDRALVVLFVAPHSFTGEDVVEVQGHGGRVIGRRLLEAARAAGARLARPGEFSRRALENGRLDLVQAEGLAELIAASSEAGLRAARGLFGGALSRRLTALDQRLASVLAEIEAAIDFPDDVEAPEEGSLAGALRALEEDLGRLEASWERGRRAREGARVVLLGPPNAGKSTLFNALCGEARAIVHAEAGTTRDRIEAGVEIAGHRITLVDTAGLREAANAVEEEGVERALEAARGADLVLWLQEAGVPARPPPEVGPRLLEVVTKIDLPRRAAPAPAPGAVRTSGRTGEGLDALRAALVDALGLRDGEGMGEGEVILTLGRHAELVGRARRACTAAAEILEAGGGLDALAEEVRDARRALAEALGREALSEEVLDTIFGRFCLGK